VIARGVARATVALELGAVVGVVTSARQAFFVVAWMFCWYTRRMVHYSDVGANALAFSRMRLADSSMVSRTLQMAKRTSARGVGLGSEGA